MTILIGFMFFILSLLISSGFSQKTFVPKRCPPGACETNLSTGVKTCPDNSTDSLIYDPSQSICNSQFLCDNPVTPFAIQSDGSTNNNGVCESNISCRCTSVAQCPDYIVSIFTTSNGNPYADYQGQRLSFPQLSSYVPIVGDPVTEPPIQLSNAFTNFCSVSVNWMALSTPGCNFANAVTPSYEDIVTCMGMGSNCVGSPNGNPCLQGTLAFIGNAQSMTQLNFDTFLLGCVAGPQCPCGEVAIYDQGYGGIVCRNLV